MRHYLFFSLLFVAIAAACVSSPTPVLPTATQNPLLTPYLVPDSTQTPTGRAPQPAATFTPLPTPTPFTYPVQEGDTLLAIAFRFNVTVDDIMSVNPGINPNLLSVGTNLVIPLGEEGVGVIPTPTPAPLKTRLPECYPSLDGGMWCFLLVVNEQPTAVEGVIGEISLYAEDGEILVSEIAYLPMDRIFSGARLPLVAYFSPPAPRNQYVQGLLLGAFQIDPERVPFLSAETRNLQITVRPDARSAVVSGQISPGIVEENESAGMLVVVAVAYGEANQVVGLRKWEAGSSGSDQEVPFSLTVFSLGPPIVDVEVAAEYRRPGEEGDGTSMP
jgi:LysM repeat protein